MWTISDSTKVESVAEYKDVYAYLEKYKKDQERETVHTLQTGQDY